MDQKPIAPFEAPAPERIQYQGPLILPQRPATAQAPAPTERLPAAARLRAGERFAGARPVREWPQAWML